MMKTFTFAALGALIAATAASAADGEVNEQIRDDLRLEQSGAGYSEYQGDNMVTPIPDDYSASATEWNGYDGYGYRPRIRQDADVNGD